MIASTIVVNVLVYSRPHLVVSPAEGTECVSFQEKTLIFCRYLFLVLPVVPKID